MKTKELIKEVEKEIEETKEKLLSILRPLYDKALSEVIEILGEDMLFYGDCCKREAKLEGIKLGAKAKEEEIREGIIGFFKKELGFGNKDYNELLKKLRDNLLKDLEEKEE